MKRNETTAVKRGTPSQYLLNRLSLPLGKLETEKEKKIDEEGSREVKMRRRMYTPGENAIKLPV